MNSDEKSESKEEPSDKDEDYVDDGNNEDDDDDDEEAVEEPKPQHARKKSSRKRCSLPLSPMIPKAPPPKKPRRGFRASDYNTDDEDEEDFMPTSTRKTEKGGYAHTKKSRARIGKANRGNTPWNKGRTRSEADKAKIAAGVRKRNRAILLEKLKKLNLTEDQWHKKRKEIKYLRERIRRAKVSAKKRAEGIEKRKKKQEEGTGTSDLFQLEAQLKAAIADRDRVNQVKTGPTEQPQMTQNDEKKVEDSPAASLTEKTEENLQAPTQPQLTQNDGKKKDLPASDSEMEKKPQAAAQAQMVQNDGGKDEGSPMVIEKMETNQNLELKLQENTVEKNLGDDEMQEAEITGKQQDEDMVKESEEKEGAEEEEKNDTAVDQEVEEGKDGKSKSSRKKTKRRTKSKSKKKSEADDAAKKKPKKLYKTLSNFTFEMKWERHEYDGDDEKEKETAEDTPMPDTSDKNTNDDGENKDEEENKEEKIKKKPTILLNASKIRIGNEDKIGEKIVCPDGGPGGLVCCPACISKYNDYLTQTAHDMDCQRTNFIARQTEELLGYIEENRIKLLSAKERAKKVPPPPPRILMGAVDQPLGQDDMEWTMTSTLDLGTGTTNTAKI